MMTHGISHFYHENDHTWVTEWVSQSCLLCKHPYSSDNQPEKKLEKIGSHSAKKKSLAFFLFTNIYALFLLLIHQSKHRSQSSLVRIQFMWAACVQFLEVRSFLFFLLLLYQSNKRKWYDHVDNRWTDLSKPLLRNKNKPYLLYSTTTSSYIFMEQEKKVQEFFFFFWRIEKKYTRSSEQRLVTRFFAVFHEVRTRGIYFFHFIPEHKKMYPFHLTFFSLVSIFLKIYTNLCFRDSEWRKMIPLARNGNMLGAKKKSGFPHLIWVCNMWTQWGKVQRELLKV